MSIGADFKLTHYPMKSPAPAVERTGRSTPKSTAPVVHPRRQVIAVTGACQALCRSPLRNRL